MREYAKRVPDILGFSSFFSTRASTVAPVTSMGTGSDLHASVISLNIGVSSFQLL